MTKGPEHKGLVLNRQLRVMIDLERVEHILSKESGRNQSVTHTKYEHNWSWFLFLQTLMFGKNFMKIGPTVWKIQASKSFKITVIGAAILIWQSRDQFLKISLHRSISVCDHNSGEFRLIVTQIIHLISILVDIFTGINVIWIIKLWGYDAITQRQSRDLYQGSHC